MAKLRAAINLAIQNATAVPSPFDQSILGEDDAPGRKSVKAVVDGLHDLTKVVGAYAKSPGITIKLPGS